MKRGYVIAINVGYWLFLVLLIVILFIASQINEVTGPSFFSFSVLVGGYVIIPSIISFYGSYFFLFRFFVQRIGSLKLLILCLSLLAISSSVALINIYSFVGTPRVLFEVGFVSLLLNSFNALIGFILHSFISWFTDLNEKEERNKKAKMMELEMLKLKLDPHFLFNTINNIDVLIENDSVKASEYIIKLSSILRFYLYKTSDSVIKLSDELKYIQEYVDLQKIRTSNDHFVRLSINGNTGNKEIAPMIFIPFIENAFKHSKNKKTNNIDVHFLILDEEIVFECKNKFDSSGANRTNGIGNNLIKDRLALIYGDKYELDVINSATDYTVKLKVPI